MSGNGPRNLYVLKLRLVILILSKYQECVLGDFQNLDAAEVICKASSLLTSDMCHQGVALRIKPASTGKAHMVFGPKEPL